jgi:hypothetical protein
MIDECAVGAIQIHDRNLSYILVCPEFGVLARCRGVIHDNIVCDSAANRSLPIL